MLTCRAFTFDNVVVKGNNAIERQANIYPYIDPPFSYECPVNPMSANNSHQTTADTDADIDLEQLIYDIAEHARDEDYDLLYQSLYDRELFIPVEQEALKSLSEHVESGSPFQTDGNAAARMRNVEGPKGEAMIPVVTQPGLPMVVEAHVGMYWREALGMVLKTEEVAGILLHGENSWIVFYKPQIENILATYREQEQHQPQ